MLLLSVCGETKTGRKVKQGGSKIAMTGISKEEDGERGAIQWKMGKTTDISQIAPTGQAILGLFDCRQVAFTFVVYPSRKLCRERDCDVYNARNDLPPPFFHLSPSDICG